MLLDTAYYCLGEVSGEMSLDTAYCLLWFMVKCCLTTHVLLLRCSVAWKLGVLLTCIGGPLHGSCVDY
jgi:hypothetical protein